MTNNQPPLTAESIMHAHGLCCDDEELDALVIEDINTLIAQQTQALQQRVDALQIKLDDAQAQMAMLVEKLAILIDEITDNGSYPYDTPKEITVHNSMGAVLNTQNAAEQWKANLLKPWREAVTVLRGALRLAYRELNEIWARTGAPCDGLGTKMVDEDYFEEVIKDVRKALKATEGLEMN